MLFVWKSDARIVGLGRSESLLQAILCLTISVLELFGAAGSTPSPTTKTIGHIVFIVMKQICRRDWAGAGEVRGGGVEEGGEI